jgi:Flp pilus assembly protein TadG
MILRHHPARRPGTIVPYVAVSSIFLFSLIAFAIDIGLVALARNHCQNAADAAAMNGVRQLTGDQSDPTNLNNYNAVGPAVNAVASANNVVSVPIDPPTQVTTNIGWYSYDQTTQKFTATFGSSLPANQNWTAVQVTVTRNQPTYFAQVMGISSLPASGVATAVCRPRDIALVLDFSGSMRFSSETGYPSYAVGGAITGSLNPDTAVPQFGHWSTAGYQSVMYRTTPYLDPGGEAHAANNLTVATAYGPPVVQDFESFDAGGNLINAFYRPGDPTYQCPAPADWGTQSSATKTYVGDRWPQANEANAAPASNPTFAMTVQHYLFGTTNNPTYAPSTHPRSSQPGPGGGAFDPANPLLPLSTEGYGPTFKGYSMGPAYYGKTFYVWPPDPRYHPTNAALQLDWRQKFFTTGPAGTGSRVNDNSRLWNSGGVWQPSGSATYYIDYNAVISWINSGPQVFPSNLRCGRVLYYTSIPTTIPDTGGTADQRFWRAYIDYVLGAGNSTVQSHTLYGVHGSAAWGTVQITPRSSLATTNTPYMQYNDMPIHPRLHFWFGPLSMLDFLALNNTNFDNWWPGACHESQCWQLKAGIQSSLEDIQANHPNDWAALIYFSSLTQFNTARVQMGRKYSLMKNMLWFPNVAGSQGTNIAQNPSLNNEWQPFNAGTFYSSRIDQAASNNPFRSGSLGPGYIPNANSGTSPEMGFKVAYNEFSSASGFYGRRGAAKVVIYETDGVCNTTANGTWTAGTPAPYNSQYTGISNGSGLGNANATVIANAKAAAQAIYNLDSNTTLPGYSTPRTPVLIHALAFGFLFESYTDVPGALGPATPVPAMRDPAMQAMYDIETVGSVSPPSSDPARRIATYKLIIGDYNSRINRLRTAMQIIMQSGAQCALIQ